MAKEWFTVPELVAEQFAGFTGGSSWLTRRLNRERWWKKGRARRRNDGGRSTEYHYTLLPDAAQAAWSAKYGAVRDETEARLRKLGICLPVPPTMDCIG